MKTKLSPFLRHMAWVFFILLATILLSFVDVGRTGKSDEPFYLITTRYIPWFVLFIWSVNFTQDMRDILAFNYTMIKNGDLINVRYMTFFWIFPFDVIYFTKSYFYDYQNLFGGTMTSVSTYKRAFYSEEEAMIEINKHSLELRAKRMVFFKCEKVAKKEYLKVKM